jgi:hypothetical protein
MWARVVKRSYRGRHCKDTHQALSTVVMGLYGVEWLAPDLAHEMSAFPAVRVGEHAKRGVLFESRHGPVIPPVRGGRIFGSQSGRASRSAVVLSSQAITASSVIRAPKVCPGNYHVFITQCLKICAASH